MVVFQSQHPIVRHKITLMRKSGTSPKYLRQLMHEVSSFLCYEATASLALEATTVETCAGKTEAGERVAGKIGVVPILRGGLGMVDAMLEQVTNAQVWHLGIYRDKSSLLAIEYYNKLPKKVTVHTAFVLDPMPISGATAVAAIDIMKAWGASAETPTPFVVKFVCLVASTDARERYALPFCAPRRGWTRPPRARSPARLPRAFLLTPAPTRPRP